MHAKTQVTLWAAVVWVLGMFAQRVLADEPEAAAPAAALSAATQLTYQTGDIPLPNKITTLHLGSEQRYLDPTEAAKLLVAWGNPPDAVQDTQGIIVPAGIEPFAENSWVVVLRYENDGHIDDSDARDIDYTKLLADMQEGTADENESRKKQGFESIEIVGWATPPRYDAAGHRLYWAKDLKFGRGDSHTLNYDVRVLGRDGVLSMNAVGSLSQLSMIEREMQSLMQVAAFNPGKRYEEFNKGTDKLAAYGLAALVAGGIAAKTGFFGKIALLLLGLKKILIPVFLALAAVFGKFFKGRKKAD